MLCSGLFTLRRRLHSGEGPSVSDGLDVETLRNGNIEASWLVLSWFTFSSFVGVCLVYLL